MRSSVLQLLGCMALGLFASTAWAASPDVTLGTPAAGERVRVTAPEYAGTNVYHTLALPTNWQPGGLYPVIVEFAPNQSGPFAGTVEDTHLGFYESGGTDFIWVTMPFIDYAADPERNATTWFGNGTATDPTGQQRTADYVETNLVRIMEDYGGDTSSVFLTGFSRGAIGTGYVGLSSDEMADIWLGFLPHSHYDGFGITADPGNQRASRIDGRASFITYGNSSPPPIAGGDGGAANSIAGRNNLNALGFPVEAYEMDIDHTDEWITDANTPVASTTAYVDGSTVANLADVRARMRDWIDEVIADKRGTHSISGLVTDALGNPLAGARLQSGHTHWTYTDENGLYELAGLIDSDRALTVSHSEFAFTSDTVHVAMDGQNLTGFDFQAASAVPEPPGALALLTAVAVWAALATRRKRLLLANG